MPSPRPSPMNRRGGNRSHSSTPSTHLSANWIKREEDEKEIIVGCLRVKKSFLPAILVLILAMFPSVVFGQDMAELEIDHALTFDFSTPHTEWARPYAKGKVRVLFFTDGTGVNSRECVELMQRFDIDAKAVFWIQAGDDSKQPTGTGVRWESAG